MTSEFETNPVLVISWFLHIKKSYWSCIWCFRVSIITVQADLSYAHHEQLHRSTILQWSHEQKTKGKKKREKWVTFAVQCRSKAKVSAHICCLSTPIKDAQTKMHFNIAANSLPARNAVFPAETPDKAQIPPSQLRWSDVK